MGIASMARSNRAGRRAGRSLALLTVASLSACGGASGSLSAPTSPSASTASTSATVVVVTTTTSTSTTFLPTTSTTAAPLPVVQLGALFGSSPPARVVLARTEGYEVWEAGSSRWIPNPRAGETLAVEGAYASLIDAKELFTLDGRDVGQLGRPIVRGSRTLVWTYWPDFRFVDLETGQPVDPPVAISWHGEAGESAWLERNGVVVAVWIDIEGDLTDAHLPGGPSLIGADYPGLATLSTDGTLLAYADYRGQVGPHDSPVLVVRRVADGGELFRRDLGQTIGDIQLARPWLVVNHVSGPMPTDRPGITVINLDTGATTSFATSTRVFLPAG